MGCGRTGKGGGRVWETLLGVGTRWEYWDQGGGSTGVTSSPATSTRELRMLVIEMGHSLFLP